MEMLRKYAAMACLLILTATIVPVYGNSTKGQGGVKQEKATVELKEAKSTWSDRAGTAVRVLALVGLFVMPMLYAKKVSSLMRADEALMQKLKEQREQRGQFLLDLFKRFNIPSVSVDSAAAIMDGGVAVLAGAGIIVTSIALAKLLAKLLKKNKNKAEMASQ